MQRVTHLDEVALEPSVVENYSGALFTTGYWTPMPRMWTSSDRGSSWTRLNLGTVRDGAIGNSDVGLTVAPDGTLYFVAMLFDTVAKEGRAINMAVSRDAGVSWAWQSLSARRFDDRPWVAAAPNGSAHVIWNDGSGVLHTVTRDRGNTWRDPQRVASRGGSSHLAVGPNGEVAIRLVPPSASGPKFDPGVDSIIISNNAGTTWKRRSAPGERDWAKEGTPATTPRWVEPLAWDGAGRLYSLWTNSDSVWLARSTDQGATWRTWVISTEADAAYYPYVIAKGDGDVAATWFVGRGRRVSWRAACLHIADSSAYVSKSSLLPIDAWRLQDAANWRLQWVPGDSLIHDTGGEYLGVTFLQEGGIGVVTPVEAASRRGFTWWKLGGCPGEGRPPRR